ncbi:MAG: ribosome biogenesis factor YjgA [bacterium]
MAAKKYQRDELTNDDWVDDDEGVTVVWEVPTPQMQTMPDPNEPIPEKEYAIRPNKTQLKRETQAIQTLVLDLLKQDAASLARLPISEKLSTELFTAKKLQKSALKRQIKYLTSLLRDQGADFITVLQQTLVDQQRPHQQQVAQFHQIETWRDRLLAGDQTCLQDLYARYTADFDMQYVRQLIRNAKKEQQHNKPPKSSRALFQYLKGLAD